MYCFLYKGFHMKLICIYGIKLPKGFLNLIQQCFISHYALNPPML